MIGAAAIRHGERPASGFRINDGAEQSDQYRGGTNSSRPAVGAEEVTLHIESGPKATSSTRVVSPGGVRLGEEENKEGQGVHRPVHHRGGESGGSSSGADDREHSGQQLRELGPLVPQSAGDGIAVHRQSTGTTNVSGESIANPRMMIRRTLAQPHAGS